MLETSSLAPQLADESVGKGDKAVVACVDVVAQAGHVGVPGVEQADSVDLQVTTTDSEAADHTTSDQIASRAQIAQVSPAVSAIQGAVIAEHKCKGRTSVAGAAVEQSLITKNATNDSGTLGDKKAQSIAHYTEQELQKLPASTSTKDRQIGQLEDQNLRHSLVHSRADMEQSPRLQKESRSTVELTPKSAKEHEWQLVVSNKKRGSREDSKANPSRMFFDHNTQDVRSGFSEPQQVKFLKPSWADQVEEEMEQPTLQQTLPQTTEDTTSDKVIGNVDKGHASGTKESKEDYTTTRGEDKPRRVSFHGQVTIHLFEKEEERRSERLTPKHTPHTEKEFRAQVVDAQHNEGWPLKAPQGKQAQTPGKKAKSNDTG